MKKLILLLMVVSLVCVVNAATIRYMNSGSWDQLATPPAPWTGTGWQSTAAPGSADVARANWGGWVGNTITLDGAANPITRFELGVDESGKLVVGNGGSITTTSNSKVGNNNWVTGTLIINQGGTVTNNSWFGVATGNGGVKNAGWNGNAVQAWGPTYGVVEINGGTLNVASHLWAATGGTHASSGGQPTSRATITINNGGVINVSGNLGLGTINAISPSAGGGIATLTVNHGGLLNLAYWDDLNSIMNGSAIWIEGSGKVVVGGNRLTAVENYAAVGKISTNWEDGITATYDAVTNKTTIIPEPATLVLLGLGALTLLKKKR